MSVAWLSALVLGLTPYAAGGVNVEVRGGEAPVVPRDPPRASAVAAVTPTIAVGAQDATTQLRLSYSPRFLWRQPNPAGSQGVLLLHQAQLTLDDQLTRQVRWTAGVGGYAGELDYFGLRAMLGNTQSALPQSTKVAQVSAATGVSVHTSPDWTHSLQARASHLRPLQDVPMTPGGAGVPLVLPKNTNVGLLYTAAHDLNRQDVVAFDFDAAYWAFSPGLELLTFTPQGRWRRALAPHDTLLVATGVTVSDRLRNAATTTNPNASRWSAVPIGLVDLTTRLATTRDFEVDGITGVAVAYWVDPVLGQAAARGSVHAGLAARFPRDVSAAIDVSAATNLSRHAQPGDPDETMFYAQAPLRWRVNSELTLEGGARWLERAPHWSSDDFHLRQHEIWIYAAATVVFTTQSVHRAPGGPEAGAAR